VVRVEQWAEIRRLYFVKGLSIKEIVRRSGRGRNTVRRALRSKAPPAYSRPRRPSKLEPFREEIHRLLGEDARLSVPTPEHYLPLLYIAALQAEGETMDFIVDGYEAGSLGMLTTAAGMPAS